MAMWHAECGWAMYTEQMDAACPVRDKVQESTEQGSMKKWLDHLLWEKVEEYVWSSG